MIISSIEKALSKAKKNIFYKLNEYFSPGKKPDNLFWEELEEVLIEGDVSYKIVQELLINLKAVTKQKQINDNTKIKEELQNLLIEEFKKNQCTREYKKPFILFLIGVNGVGKTTCAAKLANYFIKKFSAKPIFCAADTFRAGAIEQLKIWADRLNIDIVKHKEGADPSAVLFDTIKAASSRGKDLIIVDTAGRLHTKRNLMAELEKMQRVAKKEVPEKDIENLLILDATVGQNGFFQAHTFTSHLKIHGIILTKLDGTAKGGIALSIVKELKIPIKFVSYGEEIEEFIEFSPPDYCKALLG